MYVVVVVAIHFNYSTFSPDQVKPKFTGDNNLFTVQAVSKMLLVMVVRDICDIDTINLGVKRALIAAWLYQVQNVERTLSPNLKCCQHVSPNEEYCHKMGNVM